MLLNQDLGPALRSAARDGVGYLPAALPESSCQGLLAEVSDGDFVELPAVQGRYAVRQQATHRVLTGAGIAALPGVEAFRRAVVDAVLAHADEISGLDAWAPDEVSVQRYAPGSTGISVHRDGRRYRQLVAILTLEGSARLWLCADRSGTAVESWNADAGSLILLRGPGLGGAADGRPLHAVDGPLTRSRTSLTLRWQAG